MSGRTNTCGQFHRKGFTLVEAIVVIAILLILSTGITIGVGTWIHWSQFNEQNEYARMLYSAAQNQMTEYSAHGELEEKVDEKIWDEDGSFYKNVIDFDSFGLINGDGKIIELDDLWPARKDKGDKNKYTGQVCYAMGTAQDFADYRTGDLNGEDKKEVRMMYDMLVPYLSDTSILEATVCMEFTPEDGQVYSVLYSNNAKNREHPFRYEDSSVTRGEVSIHSRKADYRSDRMVGYYGVGSLSHATGVNAEKPSFANVKLNNEETLNLSFCVSEVEESVNRMTYTIGVYDKDTKKKRMELLLDGSRLAPAGSSVDYKVINCQVFRYRSDGVKWERDSREELPTELPVLVRQESDNTICLILDGADLTAASTAYRAVCGELTDAAAVGSGSDAYRQYMKTYSFSRFGIDPEEIYCTVQGAGSVYKTTIKKQSNSSSVYFEAKQESGDGAGAQTVYIIGNGRHLYNIRYVEDRSPAVSYARSYQLSRNIRWDEFVKTGLYYTGAVRPGRDDTLRSVIQDLTPEDSTVVRDNGTAIPFPSVGMLGKEAVFTSRNVTAAVLSHISFNEDDNRYLELYADVAANGVITEGSKSGPTGLFAINEGTIENVTFDSSAVCGSDGVGTFCGENRGDLKKLTVKKGATAEGTANVGGIVGKDTGAASGNGVYMGLDNYASVTGVSYVGGIVGRISVAGGTVVLDGCRNYGVVEAKKAEDDSPAGRARAKYIGGIAGYAENTTGAVDNLTFKNCSGCPLYGEDDIKAILEDDGALKEKLNGVYVGGIIGYNKGGRLEKCHGRNTGAENSYLFGYKYVGGIVGFNEGVADNRLDGSGSITDINVMGDSYVGGISGANGKLSHSRDPEDGVPVPDPAVDPDIRIANWVNQGMVAAAGDYAGGITGYNTGRLENCGSDVSADQTAKNITGAKLLQKGNYIGGIAGYNGGAVTSDTRREVLSYLTGSDYVGGVIGYNDVGAELSGYSLLGGYVKGMGSFTGGFIGLNASDRLFAPSEETALAGPLCADPNQVQGDFCVGGVIGGNLVALADDEDVYVNMQVNNFLGSVEGAAFTGGHIGYNRLFEEGTSKERILEYAGLMCREEMKADEWKDTTNGNIRAQKYAQLISDVSTLGAGDYRDSGARIAIVGDKGSTAGSVRLNNVTTDIFSGGVVGYNAEGTRLLIKNMINRTLVRAEVITQNRNEHPMGANRFYSYSGGIISKVTGNAVIDNCENQEEGDNDSGGDYLGGICEINAGTVRNCPAPSIGRAGRNSVGGIVGLNNGAIENCILGEYTTVTGESQVGGIAAENYGTITDTQLENGTVQAFGSIAGGAVALNYGTIRFVSVTGGSAAVSAAEDYAGGIVGKNLAASASHVGRMAAQGRYAFSGSVSGQKYVGGVIGAVNVDDGVIVSSMMFENWNNSATVIAENGAAGGIIGDGKAGLVSLVQNCENTGNVRAAAQGDAAGIIPSVFGARVMNCVNRGDVSAANGIAGGIVAYCESTSLYNCAVEGVKARLVTVEGRLYTGGIAGHMKNGSFASCRAEYALVRNTADSGESTGGSSTGGLVGFNQLGSLQNSTVSQSQIRLCVSGSDQYAGGAIGNNQGGAATLTVTGCSIALAGGATYGNLGGIAGQSYKGSMDNCTVQADITGDMGSEGTGYGGVVGNLDLCNVRNCCYSGTMRANGSSDNMVSMGGIAGIVGSSGQVGMCYVGTDKDTVIACGDEASKKTAAGHVGGIAGQSSGAVYNSGVDPKKQDHTVQVTNCIGNTGGIVGLQNPGATVDSDTTGQKWTVRSIWYVSSTGTGGIMGYCLSGNNVKNCKNYANVSSAYVESDNVAVGGLTGRLENNQRNGMIVEGFENYGDITGTIVGGAVGRIKYKGLTFDHCVNYGTITSDNAEGKSKGAGGLVGNFISNGEKNDYFAFSSCKNFGNIKTLQNAGGIAGYASDDSTVNIYYSDCVNVGAIDIEKDSFGGIVSSVVNQNAYFYRCRNYGNVKGKESKINKGILGAKPDGKKQTGTAKLQDCFNFGMPRGIYAENTRSNNYTLKDPNSSSRTSSIEEVAVVLNYDDSDDQNRKLLSGSKVILSGLKHNPGDRGVREDVTSKCDWRVTDANEAGNKNLLRQKNYLGTDPHVLEYYDTLSASVSGVTDLKVTNIGGRLLVTWKHNGTNYREDQLLYKTAATSWTADASKNEKTPVTIAYGVQQYVIPLSVLPSNSNSIQIAVRSVGGNYDRTDYSVFWMTDYGPSGSLSEEGATAWVKLEQTDLLPTQPTPEVHIELTPTNADKNLFTAVLENAADYKNQETVIEVSGLLGVKDQKITFKVKDGRSKPFLIDNGENANVSMVAKGISGESTDSLITTSEVALYGNKVLQTIDCVKTTFLDFYGSEMNGISNRIQMEKTGSKTYNDKSVKTELYMNTELVVDGYVIGQDSGGRDIALPVAVASGNSHVTEYGGTVISVLNQLPEDFLNYGKITARSYPWQSQGYVCWYGHPVKSGISKSDLLKYVADRSLTDTERNEAVFVEKDGKAALNDGYVLRLDANETYSVIYSSILGYEDTYGEQIDKKVYTVDWKARTVTGGSYSAKIQPEPAIEEEMVLSGEGNSYTFRWDTKNPDKSAVYRAQLVGHAKKTLAADARDVTLGEADVNASSESPLFGCTFTDRDNSWNYTDLTLSVVRKGTVDSSGKTKVFPASASRDFTARLRFSQIPRPTLTLHREDGQVDKDTLVYDLTWSTVVASERADVKAYEVRVQAPGDDGSVKEEILTYTVEDMNADSATATVMVDLNKYPPGQLLRFAVRAVAKADAVTYRDGVWGVVREMTLPSRQQVPDVTLLKSDPVYMEHEDGKTGTYMTAEEFAAGLALSLEDPEMSGIQGRYELAAAVFDRRPDTEAVQENRDRSMISAGDAPEKAADKTYWNSGAAKTLLSKSSVSAMNGSLSIATYRLAEGLDEKDAGKWLKLVLRNVSDSNVSSWWSDEDPDGETVNYCWIRIPRIQVGDVHPVEEKTALYYDMRTNQWSLKGSGGGYEAAVSQTTLRFAPVSESDGYCIQKVGLAKVSQIAPEAACERQDVDWIYLEPAEGKAGAYNVFVQSSRDGFAETSKSLNSSSAPVCKEDVHGVFAGEISAGKYVQLPFADTVQLSGGDQTAIPVATLLILSDTEEGPVFDLVLPDGENVSISGQDFADPVNYRTAQVSFRPTVLGDEHLSKYESGRISNWYRISDRNKWSTAVSTMEAYREPAAVSLTAEISGLKGIAYQVRASAKDRQVYQVTLLDRDQKTVLDRRYLGTYSGYGADIQLLLLPEDVYGAYQECYVRLKSADIIAGESVSGWSLETEPMLLPQIGLPRVEYTVGEEETAGVLIGPDGTETALAVPGNSYTWTFDPQRDVKINGYRLQIGGRETDAASYILGNGQDGWYYVNEQGEQILLGDGVRLFEMTARTTFANGETVSLRIPAELSAAVGEDGCTEFRLEMPGQYAAVSYPPGETDGEQLTFTFDSESQVFGWTYPPL